MHPEIPGQEHFISDVTAEGGTLTLRLVSEEHPGNAAAAYVLRAEEIESSGAVLAYLAERSERNEYVYVGWRGDAVAVANEAGEELLIRARSFAGRAEALNLEESSAVVKRVYGWYLAEEKAARRSDLKLSEIRAMLVEQARRTRAKAESHTPTSSAGVLYAQQLSFIERVLRVAET